MAQYSIKELEKLSGIKAHTIRIWEKRYHLIEPRRTHTNIRLYSDDDLKKLMNVSLLNARGIKISAIAGMGDEALHKKVLELSEAGHTTDVHTDRLIVNMLDLDEAGFEKELAGMEVRFGFDRMLTEIVYPFLEKTGILWQTGDITPAHEHFISNLIRQKIIVAIAGLPVPTGNGAPRAMLFLPENEMHEIGLLFYHYLARRGGLKTYYLGQSVPYDDLKKIYSVHHPHILITSFTSAPAPQALDGYLDRLARDFPSSHILASGALLRKASFHHPANVAVFQTAAELKTMIEESVRRILPNESSGSVENA